MSVRTLIILKIFMILEASCFSEKEYQIVTSFSNSSLYSQEIQVMDKTKLTAFRNKGATGEWTSA